MAGNVSEWCGGWYDPSAYTRYAAGDRTPLASGEYRAFRGGGFSSSATDCRSAGRNNVDPGASNHSIGFRVARDATGEPGQAWELLTKALAAENGGDTAGANRAYREAKAAWQREGGAASATAIEKCDRGIRRTGGGR
jgi:hypothetical protein